MENTLHENAMKKIHIDAAMRAIEMGLSYEVASKVSRLPIEVIKELEKKNINHA